MSTFSLWMSRRAWLVGLVGIVAALSINTRAAAVSDEPASAAGLDVVVTLPPLKGIVEPLLPSGSTVTMLMRPGRSEHGYEFSPSDIARLGKADLVVYIGLGLEPQVEKFLNEHPSPGRIVISMSKAIGIGNTAAADQADSNAGTPKVPSGAGAEAPKSAHRHDHAGDDHGEAGHIHDEHCDHGPVDVHIWLDPVLVRQFVPELATAVRSAMAKRGPLSDAAAARVSESAVAFDARVAAVDAEYRERLAPLAGAAIVTHHAAFGRLASRYGLRIAEVLRPVESSEPSPGQIASTVKAIRENRVRAIFVEPQFNPSAAERLARSARVKLGRLDPLGDGDWFAMMRGNLGELAGKLAE